MTAGYPRILVLRGGAIGDFLVTMPALCALRERWPLAHITLVGYPRVARLALQGGVVNEVLSLDSSGIARFFSLRPEFAPGQLDFIRSFHFVVTYLHDPEGTVRENLLNAGAPQVLYGSPLVAGRHAVDQMVQPLETLAIYAAGSAPRLVLDEAAKEEGRGLLAGFGFKEPPCILHPGSGGRRKNWPVQQYAALIDALRQRGRPVLVSLGEADETEAVEIRKACPDAALLQNRPLLELASVLVHGACYVGNDSGITHLAAALGIPVIALFGPTDPALWAPRGPHVQVLRAASQRVEDITLEEVRKLLET